ncbi:MAG TPA: hypothetical protein VGE93_17525 [Bryobacteraceae bacterium]
MTCTISIPGARRDSYSRDSVAIPYSTSAVNRQLTHLAYLADERR